MGNGFEFRNKFISYMQAMFPRSRLVSGGRELQCRCMYCADSKDPNNPGHMYIKVPQEPDDPILFNCFKCNTSGVLDSRTLLEWGIYDPSIATEADKINSAAVKHRKFKGYSKEWFPFSNHVDDYALAQIKLKYINDRIGTNLTIDECMRQKIILNLREIVDWNRLNYTRHPDIVSQLNLYFVGFLSLDNNFVNLRRICPDGVVFNSIDKRYINYNLHGKEDNTEKMYIMPTLIDLSQPIRIPIHIAEGPFDILSIRYNLRYNESYGIFAAVTGSGYKGLIKHIISSFNIFYFDLHLYPDNDKLGDSRMVDEIVQIVKPFNARVFEHRNVMDGEKDFGVPVSRIDEKIYERF